MALLVRYGLPLDFDRLNPLESYPKNHTSGDKYPLDIQTYLEEQIAKIAILGSIKGWFVNTRVAKDINQGLYIKHKNIYTSLICKYHVIVRLEQNIKKNFD